jgi:hypothetical protein
LGQRTTGHERGQQTHRKGMRLPTLAKEMVEHGVDPYVPIDQRLLTN